MLELRPNCQCCNKDLPPAAADVMICSFECTFCRDCVEATLSGRCPNCGGELVTRPIRPAEKLAQYPASTVRVTNADGCVGSLNLTAPAIEGMRSTKDSSCCGKTGHCQSISVAPHAREVSR